jgi:exonuclease SbcC
LENENAINFEEAPFSDTGVFAITGPNGSGKSTILDAITLGLFGETFRFDRPAAHVMTKHSAECYSEIEFSFGSDRFRSSWSVQRTSGDPEGELMPSEMKLIRLNGGEEILAATPQNVYSKIFEITGMNFRSFTRSILLAQGDFDAFLNALDSERLDILEKIIGADVYVDYQKEITDKADFAQKTLAALKKDSSSIQLLEPSKLEACEHDLIDFREHYEELQLEQKTLKQQQLLLNRIASIQSQIAEQEKSLKKVKLEAETEQKKLDTLTSGQSALTFKEDMEAITAASLAVHQSKETLEAFKSELKQLENRLATVNSNPNNNGDLGNVSFTEQQQTIANSRLQVNLLSSNRHAAIQLSQSLNLQIKEKTSAHSAVSSWLEEHRVDYKLVENFPEIARLKKLKGVLAELTDKQKSFSLWSTKAALIQKKNSAAFEKQEKNLATLKQELAKDEKFVEELVQGKIIEEIEEMQAEQKERVRGFQELIGLSDTHQKLNGSSGFLGLFKGKEQPDLDADALNLDLENLKGQIKREENIKLALDEKMNLEAIIKKMTAERHHLADGKPCPLCGSLLHPYAKNPPAVTNSQQALIDQQAKLKMLKAQIEATERNIVIAKKQAETNQAKQLRLQQIRSQWLTLCYRLNTASQDLDINNHKLMKQLLKNEIDELTEITSLISKYRIKQKNIAKLNSIITKKTAIIEQLQSSAQELDTEWHYKTQAQVENEAPLSKYQQEQMELSEKIREQLTVLGESMPAKGTEEDALIERLNTRRFDYETHDTRYKALTDELATLSEKLAICEAEIKDCDDGLKIYSVQLESEEITGLHLALIEKQKLIADKELILAAQNSEAGSLLQAVKEKIQGTQFTSLNQISEMLELLETMPALEQHIAELNQMAQTKALELEESQAQFAAESIGAVTEMSMDDVNSQLRSVNEKMDIAYQEAHRLDNLLKDQQRLQKQYDAILLQIEEQEKITEQCLDEKALLTVENGMAFRRRVQSQIADKLLSQTNAILEKISGRYYIRRALSEVGLALEIEDTYQRNARRLPKTLSGGESFVVSLALALGLSELANNGKSVDSLFLDEGFGNLDAETLYTVISTLESLHTHGKTVGVISHVETVQKRIKAQLQLVKKPNGMGMLKKAS